jgi:hypothetical protein
MTGKFIRNVLIKTSVLLIVVLTALGLVNTAPSISRVSIYNHWVPGRDRLPYGDTPTKSYNLTISNLDMMLASHLISAGNKPSNEYRVVLLGDSSIWGFLLKPEETLSGQLNSMDLRTTDGKHVVFYNLGYPTLSVIKDYLVLEKTLTYEPDLIIWSVTLESLVEKNALQSPMIRPGDLERLSSQFGFASPSSQNKDQVFTTFFNNRKTLSDWYRLQVYGFMWASTGIDQDYPPNPTPAQHDLEADTTLEGCQEYDYACIHALFDVLKIGVQTADNVPVWIVNEPMLVSNGLNSDTRYNFYYPRWAYDQYRAEMTTMAQGSGWTYLDLWNLAPENEFTNSAIHLSPAGEHLMATDIAAQIEKFLSLESH